METNSTIQYVQKMSVVFFLQCTCAIPQCQEKENEKENDNPAGQKADVYEPFDGFSSSSSSDMDLDVHGAGHLVANMARNRADTQALRVAKMHVVANKSLHRG
mmetsp:Transcript_17177/g.32621  ORF Transcript_17177/g.32621 Transcript_17177/m.32621 type:complete len:103 (+) Transcript_17177:870-1178(+)